MDSPSDLSPNAPPAGSDDPFKTLPENAGQSHQGTASTEGSVDSSGFEKVDHDVLEEYGHNFAQQMQQSIFGQLPDDPDNHHSDSFNMEQMQHHQDHHRVPQDAGDLIDIPRSDSPVHELDYTRAHHEPFIPREESPFVPEPVSHQLPEPHFEGHHPEPVHHHVPELHHPSYSDDLLDFGQQAKELVDEAVQEAGDKIHHEEHKEPIFGELHAPDFTEEVQHQINTVHNEVDDVLDSMNENDDFQEVVKQHHKESDDEPEPDFRRTPEPEEIPHQRHGPLTIPDQQEEEELLEDFSAPVVPDFGHRHHGFESEPRPPTPPKDISEEDFKPSLVNLGHGHATHSHADSHHSILKHSPGHADPWFDFKKVDPCLLDLVYWRDPKKSAIALSLSLLAIFIVAKYPLLSILSYSGLAVLAGTLGFRIFKAVEAQIKKTGGENPFQDYLNKDLILPQEKVHAQVDVLAENLTCLATKAKKLVFVENIFESVKFVLLLWSLTYVSAWFSGFALVILTVLGLFTIPKVYETYQEPIDQQLAVISGHVNNVTQLVEEKLPFLKRAAAEAEKKDQ